jgi:hypothetical protein
MSVQMHGTALQVCLPVPLGSSPGVEIDKDRIWSFLVLLTIFLYMDKWTHVHIIR